MAMSKQVRFLVRLLPAWAVLLLLVPVPGTAQAVDPQQLVEITVREAISTVQQNEELYASDRDALQSMIEERIAPYFDFQRMAQLAVAQPWRQATPEQRAAVAAEFRTLLIRTYSNVAFDYRSELPDIRISTQNVRDSRAVIRVEVENVDNRNAVLDIRMEDRGQGWQVIDVMVNGVSLIVNYRASFAYEIEQGGFERLIDTLRKENNPR